MQKITRILIILVAGLFFSCSGHKAPVHDDYIITEKDLIPEGLAFDARAKTLYISSTWKRKIVKVDRTGNLTDFVKEGQDGIKSVLGMEVDNKRNCLWAISSEASDVLPLRDPDSLQWRSSVYQFNLADGKLIKQYKLDSDSVFLNDLTVAGDGTVFITESRHGAVYSLVPGEDTLRLFLEPRPYTFINGVSFTDRPGSLYVSSTEGIIGINLSSKEYRLLPVAAGIDAGSVDGLCFYKNYFIAHQSSRVMRFYLSENHDRIVKADTLDSGPVFDSSTTGELDEDSYWYIVNSQIRSGIDVEKHTVKPRDDLKNIIIRKIRLSK